MTLSRNSAIAELTKKPINLIVDALIAVSASEATLIDGNYDLRQRLIKRVNRDCSRALDGDRVLLFIVHSALASIYAYDFSIPTARNVGGSARQTLADIRSSIEGHMMDYENNQVDAALFKNVPRGIAYTEWLKALIDAHPASHHDFYERFMAKEAGRSALRYYIAQESTLDPRFDDILALMQIGAPDKVKMEIATNYWDEMGNGIPSRVHTQLFSGAKKALDLTYPSSDVALSLEALICGNISSALALHRRYFYRAVGYFAAVEYLVPGRFKHVIKAWQRAGLPDIGIIYHQLHIGVDVFHAEGWFDNAITPLVEQDEESQNEITTGTMLRLNSSKRYLDAMLTTTRDMKDGPEGPPMN